MEIDVANTIKAVELLKVELLQNLTDLFGDLSAEADSETAERLSEDAARLICQTYLLCNRVGVEFSQIETKMKGMLKQGIREEHLLERRFGDLSALLACLEGKKS